MEYKYTILVNKDNLIPEHFEKYIELVTATKYDGTACKIEKETYRAYLNLKDYLEELGIEIALDEAYRSLEEQQEIMNSFILRYGEEYAKKTVAPIGASEHHLGLAIDIVIKKDDSYVTENDELIALTHENEIIHKNLSQFGFILRYPKGKEMVTGYSYESWHFRYVGKELAEIIMNKNTTLEEYYECLE